MRTSHVAVARQRVPQKVRAVHIQEAPLYNGPDATVLMKQDSVRSQQRALQMRQASARYSDRKGRSTSCRFPQLSSFTPLMERFATAASAAAGCGVSSALQVPESPLCSDSAAAGA